MAENMHNPFSDTHLQCMLEGAQELLGGERFNEIVRRMDQNGASAKTGAQSVCDSGQFLAALESVYGEAGGRGLAQRIGRAAAKYFIQSQALSAGLRSVEFQFLPTQRRMETGLRILSGLYDGENEGEPLFDGGSFWLWKLNACPACQGRPNEGHTCNFMVGFLQEFLSWTGGGKVYRVSQTEACVNGAACVFQIEKRPLD